MHKIMSDEWVEEWTAGGSTPAALILLQSAAADKAPAPLKERGRLLYKSILLNYRH